ncbi:MAG: ribosome-associated translation inhibitor RaiA [Spirochaetes bacterium]|nr:ribosome-associated translation inhibitor RaiA [Spirochaetota bacterium]
MEIRMQGTNSFTVSQRIRDYILKRVEKLNYFSSHINEISFHLAKEKLVYRITGTLSIRKSGVYQFESTADEMYTAIDKIVHKIDVKIIREKSKLQKHNKLGHQEVVEFFYEHENNVPEPTKNIGLFNKPITLLDAYLQMKVEGVDFYGFNLLQGDDMITPTFLRILDDNVVYLFKKEEVDSYNEYSLKTSDKIVEEDKKIRNIILKRLSLLDAQKGILEQDYHFNIFINNASDKINFLFKEGNGKWKLIS